MAHLVSAGRNTYYVLRRARELNTKVYLGEKRSTLGPWRIDLSEAIRFPTVDKALAFISNPVNDMTACRGYDGTFIIRVEETTEPGSTTRRLLDHGEPAPAGAVIKFHVVNLYTVADGDLQRSGGDMALGERDFDTELEAREAAVDYNRNDAGLGIRRVAITSSAPKVTRNEIVLA